MNTETFPEWTELVTIGRVAKPQGRRGEVAVNPLTDFPERFRALPRVFVEGEAGEPAPLTVENARLHKGRPVLRFAGISSIEDAEKLVGRELRIPTSDVAELPDGAYYHFELEGLEVFDRHRGFLGVAKGVLATGGTDVLVVKTVEGGELLLPFCNEICKRIDVDEGRIEVQAPEGLIELNAD